jgi:hypothetical protein
MSVPRYKARQVPTGWEVRDLAAEQVVLADVPDSHVIDVVEVLNQAYDSGVADGTASERIRHAGRVRPEAILKRKPKIISLHGERPGQTISERGGHWIAFAADAPGGGTEWFAGVVSQDDLFTALYNAGLLTREVRP